MGIATVALVIVAALAVLQSTAAVSAVVEPFNCIGFAFNITHDSYNFTSTLKSFKTTSGCNNTHIRVSKLYVKGACMNSRNNNFYVTSSLKSLSQSCHQVEGASSITCFDWYQNGPEESKIFGPNIGDVLTSEQVCWPTKEAYMYVFNSCPGPVTLNITDEITPYTDGSCDIYTIAGRKVGMSKGTAAGIAIGVIFAFLLLVGIIAGIVWCCCCQLKQ